MANEGIAIWMVGLFVAFGLFSNLIDGRGLAYNLAQGLFISLLVGAVMFLAKRAALRMVEKDR